MCECGWREIETAPTTGAALFALLITDYDRSEFPSVRQCSLEMARIIGRPIAWMPMPLPQGRGEAPEGER
jgi:hypothetical protein